MRRLYPLIYLMLLLLSLGAARAEQYATPLRTPGDLAAIAQNPSGRYALAAHIDMEGVDWLPIAFSGELDGAGYSIYNLTITRLGTGRADSVDGNRVPYDTVYAGLFSLMENAVIRNLDIVNADVSIDTRENCFIGSLAGFMRKTTIENVRVSGRLRLLCGGKMGGVGGIIGFGDGTVRDSWADVELTYVDTDRWKKCEQFLGGIAACGYIDMERCGVKVEGYASVSGYVHSGGLLGMYHVHVNAERKSHMGYVRNCTVDGHIRFYELNDDRRAYCRRFVGEPLHRSLEVADNVFTRFERDERDNYRVILLPEMCEAPQYIVEVIPPAAGEFGFTRRTCATCGYVFTDDYTRLPDAGNP